MFLLLLPTVFSNSTAYLVDYYGLNSTGGRVDEFSTDTLEEIEKLVLNFTVNISYLNETINYWYFNFSMNGTNACALGNKQNDECYESYNNEWIQFINDSETATFEDSGHAGDFIHAFIVGLGSEEVNIVLEIDEHYQNVFKWYNAGYNFSDVYWGDNSLEELRLNRPLRINVTNIPIDADQYKFDVRLNFSGSPTNPVSVYACNGNETPSSFETDLNCALIVSKLGSAFQDDGTKLRGIFTKDLVDEIGTISRIYLSTDESVNPYYIKMYGITNVNHSEQLEHSHNSGIAWHTATIGYESELNINWYYYDGVNGESAFIYNIYAESNTTSCNLIGNVSWDINPVKNYPPVISLVNPKPNENLTQPYLAEFCIDDPNTDILNSSLYLNGDLVADGLNYSGNYYWDNFVNESTYNLTLIVCEVGTSELYCINETVIITVLNYCSEDINLYSIPLEDCNDDTLEWNVSYYYIDDNYGTCCNVTGLGSDCSVGNGSFTNYTQIDDCSTLDCLYDATPYLKFFDKRIPLLCEVNKNASYGFLTYVKADDQIIQINPERILIDRFGEYNTFQSVNGLVNLYYRSSVLRPDRNVTVIVEGQNGIFYEEMVVIPTYKDPYQLQDRLFWTWNNAGLIVGAVFMILIIGVLIVILIRRFAGEWRG